MSKVEIFQKYAQGSSFVKEKFCYCGFTCNKNPKKKAKEMEMERKMQLNIIYRSKDEDDDAVEYILCLHNNRERACCIDWNILKNPLYILKTTTPVCVIVFVGQFTWLNSTRLSLKIYQNIHKKVPLKRDLNAWHNCVDHFKTKTLDCPAH